MTRVIQRPDVQLLQIAAVFADWASMITGHQRHAKNMLEELAFIGCRSCYPREY